MTLIWLFAGQTAAFAAAAKAAVVTFAEAEQGASAGARLDHKL